MYPIKLLGKEYKYNHYLRRFVQRGYYYLLYLEDF
jgi:hypothetical protein